MRTNCSTVKLSSHLFYECTSTKIVIKSCIKVTEYLNMNGAWGLNII